MYRHLPNALTASRIVLVPFLLWLLAEERYGASLVLCAVAGVTDALDGFLARRWNQVTRLGAVLDPIADKVLVVGSVVVLAGQGRVPAWLAGLVVGRDALILGGAVVYRAVTGELEIRPTLLSKVNTFLQIVVLVAAILDGAGLSLGPVLGWGFVAAGITTAGSGLHYLLAWTVKAFSRPAGGDSRP
ncbi:MULTISPECIES: CDP-alcohol phosphatidyltransferase family protein [Deferrisoma]